MMHSPVSDKVKRVRFAKKESFLARELVPVVEQTLRESPCLEKIYVTRISLSPEGGCINIFVWSMDDQMLNREALDALKMYRPAIRKLAADLLCSKWTPEISVRVDQKIDLIRHTDNLMHKVFEQEKTEKRLTLDETIDELKKTCSK